MKCIVIYFSQTGNTEKVAKAIQAGIKQAAEQCDIAKIKDVNPRRLREYDLIGVGSPAWGKAPGNVTDFINNMRFVGRKHAFAFNTNGGNPEAYFPNMVSQLKSRGLTVIGMRAWYGNCNLLHHWYPYPTKGHPDEIDLKEAEEFGKEMVENSKRISAGETQLIPPEPEMPPMPPMPPMPEVPPSADAPPSPKDVIEGFPSMVKYHKEKCRYPKCSLCMENCPVDGIDLSLDPPVIAHPCLGCEFCAQVCPTGAIDQDEWVEAVIAVSKPLMPILLLPALEKAEAEGRFRRLIQAKEIKTDTYGYDVRKKHPQWIIGKGARE